jgi:hypothetical protein
MLKKTVLVLAALVLLFLIVVALQPSSYRVARSVRIPASASELFGQVNDLRQFQTWNPWAKVDPAAKNTYAGPATGVGSSMSWAGNKNVGEGRMTITESRPAELVRVKMEFIKPFASTADAEFTFQPQGNETEVTWSMSGRKNFMSKAICLFMSMDRMIGGQFEKGLADLKSRSMNAAQLSPRPEGQPANP